MTVLLRILPLIGLFLVTCSSSFGQSQKVGNCSVVQNGTGNTASLNCDEIDATLAKQVQQILNGTKQNASTTKAISEKLDRILKHMDQADAQPLVGLKIVGAKGPAVACVNESDTIAHDILWEVVLWNRDTLEIQPLPIPTQKFEWLRPHDEGGAYDISHWFAQLKPGTHLIGTAMISCPNCVIGRTYIVSIIVGEGGWFSEINPGPGKQGKLLVPLHPESDGAMAKFLNELEVGVPVSNRIPIEDPKPL
jgi:hypothetical protein